MRAPAAPGLDDLAAALWVQAYDAAWLGQDWERLEHYLAADVEFVAPGLAASLLGRAGVLADIREMMTHTLIHEYNATDLKGYSSGPAGVITYRWQLDCTVDYERSQANGRDVLALSAAGGRWELKWRAQFRS